MSNRAFNEYDPEKIPPALTITSTKGARRKAWGLLLTWPHDCMGQAAERRAPNPAVVVEESLCVFLHRAPPEAGHVIRARAARRKGRSRPPS